MRLIKEYLHWILSQFVIVKTCPGPKLNYATALFLFFMRNLPPVVETDTLVVPFLMDSKLMFSREDKSIGCD